MTGDPRPMPVAEMIVRGLVSKGWTEQAARQWVAETQEQFRRRKADTQPRRLPVPARGV